MSERSSARTWLAAGVAAVQQVQEVRGDRRVVGLDVDALARCREMMPVEQHRRLAREQPVGDGSRAGRARGSAAGRRERLRLERAEHGATGAQHVHWVRGCGNLLEDRLQRRRQPAQAAQPA